MLTYSPTGFVQSKSDWHQLLCGHIKPSCNHGSESFFCVSGCDLAVIRMSKDMHWTLLTSRALPDRDGLLFYLVTSCRSAIVMKPVWSLQTHWILQWSLPCEHSYSNLNFLECQLFPELRSLGVHLSSTNVSFSADINPPETATAFMHSNTTTVGHVCVPACVTARWWESAGGGRERMFSVGHMFYYSWVMQPLLNVM